MSLDFDPGSLIGSIVGAGANLLIDKKNRQEREKWNQIQMEREDTAIQRRMADYAAAGINPLLALGGEGANTGSLSAPQMQSDFSGFGDDVYNSILAKGQKQQQKINDEQIKQEKENTLFEKEAHAINLDMMKSQQKSIDDMADLNRLNLMMSLGIPVGVNTFKGDDGFTKWYFTAKPDLTINPGDLPVQKLFNNQLGMSNNAYAMSLNDLLLSNKNLSWDTANRILNTINSVTGSIGNIAHFGFNWNNSNTFGDFYSHGWNENTNTNNNYLFKY